MSTLAVSSALPLTILGFVHICYAYTSFLFHLLFVNYSVWPFVDRTGCPSFDEHT